MSANEPMTQERLNAIQTRVDSATSGPWGCYGDGAHEVFDAGEYSDGDPGEVVAAVIDKLSDAVFIAEAREDIPALLAEVHRLRDELAKVREVTDEKVERACRAFGAATATVSSIPPGMSETAFIDGVGIQNRYAIRAALAALLQDGNE